MSKVKAPLSLRSLRELLAFEFFRGRKFRKGARRRGNFGLQR